jgi:small conductance mechanosensitive channel
VVVNTAFAKRRSHYDVGIGYGDDIDQAQTLIMEVLRSTEGVLHNPAPAECRIPDPNLKY